MIENDRYNLECEINYTSNILKTNSKCMTIKDFIKLLSKKHTFYERFKNNDTTIFYVDYDTDSSIETLDNDYLETLTNAQNDMKIIFPELVFDEDIVRAERHGISTKSGKLKVSIRLFIPSCKTTPKQIHLLGETNKFHFDNSVYGTDQLMGCVNGHKGTLFKMVDGKSKPYGVDNRVLELKTKHSIIDTVISAVPRDAIELDISPFIPNKNTIINKQLEFRTKLMDKEHEFRTKLMDKEHIDHTQDDYGYLTDNLQHIHIMLGLISNNYWSNWLSWWRLGSAMYNCKLSLDMYDLYSSKTQNYDTTSVQSNWKYYERYIGTHCGLGTILYYARLSNELMYNKHIGLFKLYDTYEKVKYKFEKNVIFCHNPTSFNVWDDIDMVWKPKKKTDMSVSYSNVYYWGMIQTKNNAYVITKKLFFNEWCSDPDRRECIQINFLPPPLKCDSRILNLYDGFAIENIDSDIPSDPNELLQMIEPIIKHMWYLCEKKDKCVEYFKLWLAQLVQYPGEINGVAIIFRSGQGTGKSKFIDFIGDIIGNKYKVDLTDPEHMFGRFSGVSKQGKLLVHFQESKNIKNFDSQLKNQVTDKNICVEAKGIDQKSILNFGRIIVSTNMWSTVKVEWDDRRFWALGCSEDIKQNAKYFDILIPLLDNIQIQKAFYIYLKYHVKIPYNFNFQNNRPTTEAYSDMKSYDTPDILRFGEQIYFDGNKSVNFKKIKSHELFNKFKKWKTHMGIKYEDSAVSFAAKLTQHYLTKDNSGITKKRENSGVFYMIDLGLLKPYLTSFGLDVECPEFAGSIVDFDTNENY
jgi:hypothetical protein